MTSAPLLPDRGAVCTTSSGEWGIGPDAILPSSLIRLILQTSCWGQVWLVLLSIAVFVTDIAPLELQRRILNIAVSGGSAARILALGGVYAAIALSAGLLKLAMNVYRSYLSESAVRWLRASIIRHLLRVAPSRHVPEATGVEVSLVLDEAEAIGGFVGISISEPLLQGGILLSVFGYMIYLKPLMAVAALAVFSPQLVFVPLMQSAINRRVSKRIWLLRQVSTSIVRESDAERDDGPQMNRVQQVFLLDMGIVKLKFSMNFLMNLMHHLGIAAILALGGYYVVMGQTEIGVVVAFVSGLARINDPWGDLVNWFRDLRVTQIKYTLVTQAVTMLRFSRADRGATAE